MTNKPNKRNVNKLIRLLKSIPAHNKKAKRGNKRKFTMNHWNYEQECGTMACLGGWTEVIMQKDKVQAPIKNSVDPNCVDPLSIEERAGKYLGLRDYDQMLNMFNMDAIGYCNLRIFDDEYDQDERIEIAVNMLEHFKKTGEVDWEKAINEHKANWKKG